MQPNVWNPKNEPNMSLKLQLMEQLPKFDGKGMFTYGVSIVANEYGVDCSFCSCFPLNGKFDENIQKTL